MRFWDYLRYRRRMLLAAAVCCVIFAASFALYRLPLRAVLYPVGLCLLVGLGFAVWDYRRTLKRHRALTGYGDLTAELLRELPPAGKPGRGGLPGAAAAPAAAVH